jgi:hypothetical protein
MEIIQKLFQKYRGASPPEAISVRPLRSSLPVLAGRSHRNKETCRQEMCDVHGKE